MRLAREAGLLAYGAFAARYLQEFQRRWIDTQTGSTPLEASDDVQGHADIGGSFERVYAMRLLPISLPAVAVMLPLLLIVMPLRDLFKLLMRAMI